MGISSPWADSLDIIGINLMGLSAPSSDYIVNISLQTVKQITRY